MHTAAIIGGSGIYSIPNGNFIERRIDTVYGSSLIYLGQDQWEDFIFVPRHGLEHELPPHKINYRANMKALSILGVNRICATFAVGSLNEKYPPGSLVLIDQFIDLTHGRPNTFYDTRINGVLHTDMTHPYCSVLSSRIYTAAQNNNIKVEQRGCYVCINGPRFATAAEGRMFRLLGGDVSGMTSVPEAVLARELGMHYAAVAIVVGWEPGIQNANADTSQLENTIEKYRDTIISMFVETLKVSQVSGCNCDKAAL